ncbi:MAG: LAGLIDADG family homing endonuclease [Dehalococcoidales bacterium]|nr:LAGLIDADG family homing endonuclease [Dehalococcoidales bacterium]
MIIKATNGRRRSVTHRLEAAERVDDIRFGLTEEERELVLALEREAGQGSALIQTEILDHIYHNEPVSMAQFIEDPYYLGESCSTIYPELQRDLIELFDRPYREALFTGGIGVGKCVIGDTEIYDPVYGIRTTAKKMASLGSGIGCATYDMAYGGMRAAECSAQWSGIKKIGNLKLRSGRKIGLSLDHPVLTPYGYKAASEISAGDMVATARRLPHPVSPLSVSDDEVKWVAYMLADGGCTGSSMVFTNGCEVVLSEFENITKKLGNGSNPGVSYVGKAGQATMVMPREVRWIRKRYGLYEKSIDKRVPGRFYGLDDRQLGLFLNRIWACDGWVCKRSVKSFEIGIALGSEEFVCDIQQLLLRFGIQSRVRYRSMKYTHKGERRRSDAWSLSILNSGDVLSFIKNIGLIFGKEDKCIEAIRCLSGVKANSNIDLVPIDRFILSKIRKEIGPIPKRDYWPRPPGNSFMSHETFRSFAATYDLPDWCKWWGDVFWDTVEVFDVKGYESVYDLTVPGTANFAPYGVIVHNTYVMSIAISRVIYELSCMINPQKIFGLSSGSEMVIPLISKNLPLARDIMKTAIDDKIKESPYFMTKFTPNIKMDYTLFPGNIRITIGSYGSERLLGANVFSAALDECLTKKQVVTLEKRGKVVHETVENLLEMGQADADCKMVCLDHGKKKVRSGWWRIKESTVQPIVQITAGASSLEVSCQHPILVRRGDRLVYVYAEDVVVGDTVVMEVLNATGGSKVKRRDEGYLIGNSEGTDWGSESVFREASLRGDKGKAQGGEGQTGNAAEIGRDKGKDAASDEGAEVFGRDTAENEGSCYSENLRSRVAEKTIRKIEEGAGRGAGYSSSSCVEGGRQPLVREKDDQKAAEEIERGCQAERGASPYGGIEGEDFTRERSVNQGSSAELQISGSVTMRGIGSVSNAIRTEIGGESVPTGRGIECGWGGSDGVGVVSTKRTGSNDGCGFQGDDAGRIGYYNRGERSIVALLSKGEGSVPCDVETLCSEQFPDDFGSEQQAASERPSGAVRDSGFRGRGNEESEDTSTPDEDSQAVGVRPEWLNISELPDSLDLVTVTSVEFLPPEQTYSICTEFNTFIAGGIVVHNTNFPPKRKAQQIATAFGQKLKAAHFDIVEKMYRSLLRRIKSRFQKAGGGFPGMVILASSAATIESFTERKMREGLEDPNIFVRDHTQWTAKPAENFCGEFFYVLCSTSATKSRILNEKEYDLITDEFLEANDAFVMDIPVEFRDDFESNMEEALRDIAGFSTQAISQFVQRPKMIQVCTDSLRSHPFSEEEWVAGGPGQIDWDTLAVSYEHKLAGGYTETRWKPRRNPKAMRWCHIDTSVSGDSSGFCIGHIDKWVEVVRRDADGNIQTDLAPYYVIDFMLRINPPPAEQIYMPDLRVLLYMFMDHGFKFIGFSTDRYQSVEMHQQVKRRGIHTQLISMDTSTEPYDELKSAFYEERIEIYKYKPFIEEFKSLEYDRLVGKIDHPVAGSKDVADAVAGVVQGLKKSGERMPLHGQSEKVEKPTHEDAWVMEKIPAALVDTEAVKMAKEDRATEDFMPILIGE